MQIYFAPLEGITDAVFRRVHHACFSGVDKYFIPFVNPNQNLDLPPREWKAVSPGENAGVPAVPQILAKDPKLFIWAAERLAEMGYKEVNLNLGCPSGTVTAKGKGSGMLADPDALKRFLDGIFAQRSIDISVKTRIGYDSCVEWPELIEVLAQYPMKELIVHPRVRSELYRGMPHEGAFEYALSRTRIPLVYNGDLFDMEDCRAAAKRFAGADLMIGRGMLANPALAEAFSGGQALTAGRLRSFHDRLYAEYEGCMPKNVLLVRMRTMMQYIGCCFENSGRAVKAIHKSKDAAGYLQAVEKLFAEHTLRPIPGYMK